MCQALFSVLVFFFLYEPSCVICRDGRHHKGDEKGGKKADSQQIAQQLASVALSGYEPK